MSHKAVSKAQSVLNTFGVVLIVWSLYRFNFTGLPEWFDEFIAKPIVFVLPAFLYIKRIEKKPFFDSIWLHAKSLKSDLAVGLGLGAIFLFSALFANYIRFGNINIGETILSPTFLFAAVLTLATALSEEIFSRGYLLKRLYEEWGSIYSSSFVASILFLVIHIPILITNLKLSGALLMLFFATDFILSLVSSFVYLEKKSLLAPILIHAFYNLAILFYL